MVRAAWWIATTSALLLSARLACAQSDAEVASRRLMLEDAQRAHNAGDHARALELANNAARIQMTPSLRMFIAEEEVALGRFPEAFASADQCIRDVDRDPTLHSAAEIRATCDRVRTEARSNIASVVVRVPSPAPAGLEIRVNGQPLSASLYGAPFVVRAGAFSVDASAPGSSPFHHEGTVAAGATSDVTVALTIASASSAPASPPPATHTPFPTLAVVILGGGGVAFIASAGFYAAQQSALSACISDGADGLLCHTHDAANASVWNASTNLALAVGGVAVIAGAVVLFVRLRHRDRAPTVGWLPNEHGGTVFVGGTL